jgi:exo-beta-1,3-glucanase (GH17 family)
MAPVKVEIVRTDDGYQLLRGGNPYAIRGAGMGFDDVERFAAHGGNSMRTWNVGKDHGDTKAILDTAHANGVTVALGLPMKAERHGFDYADDEAVEAQLDRFRETVLRFRDHPALLFWIIGNELNLSYRNPTVFDAVNDVAAMIREADPNHPATTALSGFHPEDIEVVRERTPALDFLSFQMYGSLFDLRNRLGAMDYRDPFMITEWGTIGYWEMESTTWGAPVELTSSEKADVFGRAIAEILEPLGGQLLGSYVFLWGQKQERTPTWFGLFTTAGEPTEAIDVLHRAWTSAEPVNRAPRVDTLLLDGRSSRQSVTLSAGGRYQAEFRVRDPEGGEVTYRWEVKRESNATSEGGDFESQLPSLEGVLEKAVGDTATIVAPRPGNYRLFAYAVDAQGAAAHANIPFRVEADLSQTSNDLISGEVMALSYSGFRKGQHPDLGSGAVNPSEEQILEDLQILVEHDFRLLRLYDAGENASTALRLIRKHGLPLKILLGIWLKAEISNHEGCPWLDIPIADDVVAENTLWNEEEIRRGIGLANDYEDIVVALNVGNEVLVEWTDHMVPLESVISYVRDVRSAVKQPVTVADNYDWWSRHGAALAAEVDFLGIHTYALWEEKDIEEGVPFTLANLQRVREAFPDKPYAILEAGWASLASEFGERASEASEAKQQQYFAEIGRWSLENNVTVFFFEAFDEPWKGDPADPLGAEKHWGLFRVDRSPKRVMEERQYAYLERD